MSEKEAKEDIEAKESKSEGTYQTDTTINQGRSQIITQQQEILAEIALERPSAILLRFYEVLSSIKETTKSYIQYAQENLQQFLMKHWGEPQLMEIINRLRDQSYFDRGESPEAPIVFKEKQTPKAIQGSIIFYVNWRLQHDGGNDVGWDGSPHNSLLKFMWFEGYAQGNIMSQ